MAGLKADYFVFCFVVVCYGVCVSSEVSTEEHG